MARRAEEIRAAIGPEHPVGANRAAERLAERLGLEVEGADVRLLAEQGLLHAVGDYKGFNLYDCRDVDEIDPALVEQCVVERLAWAEASMYTRDAAKQLGWTLEEFLRVAGERSLRQGRFGRFLRDDVELLHDDEELDEAVRGARLLGSDEAAHLIELQRRDFDYCVAAGWVSPADEVDRKVGRRRWVVVPLYRASDVLAVLEIPGVAWDEVRSVPPGQPSRLREFASLPLARATLVRGFAADLGERHGITVTADYDDRRDRWELEWAPNAERAPSREDVRAALLADPDLKPHSPRIALRVSTSDKES
ncbi:hypothetical protein BC739_006636 [Kutzneria viridogrisea]|uniref:Uncharacterized protein n=1 Tax=Kutzneria viridogrisea TaxID=47990 RepID=A0ABR6BRA9_9PSEU|nr:hypothetical protein [Kutzneria viridogrisea]